METVCPESQVSPPRVFMWPVGLGKSPECSALKLSDGKGQYPVCPEQSQARRGLMYSSAWVSMRGSMELGWVLQIPLREVPWPLSTRCPQLGQTGSCTDSSYGFRQRAMSMSLCRWVVGGIQGSLGTVLKMGMGSWWSRLGIQLDVRSWENMEGLVWAWD